MRVELVTVQGDTPHQGKMHVPEVFRDPGKTQFGTPLGQFHATPALIGHPDHEQIGRAGAPMFLILACRLSEPRRQGNTLFLMQYLKENVHADRWMVGVQRELVDVEDRFQMVNKFAVRLQLRTFQGCIRFF